MTKQTRYPLIETELPTGKIRFTIRGRRPKGVAGRMDTSTRKKVPAQVNASFTQKKNESRADVKARAEQRVHELIQEDVMHSLSKPSKPTSLTSDQIKSTELAVQVMAEKGIDASIFELVERGIKTWRSNTTPAILSECIPLYAAYRERKGLYDQVYKLKKGKLQGSALGSVLNRFTQFVGADCDLNKLMSKDVSDFLESKHFKNNMQLHSCALLAAFFNFLITRPDQTSDSRTPLMFENPAKDHVKEMKEMKPERDLPRIWTLKEVRKAFEVAESYKNGEGLMYLALTVFAGIRPHVDGGEITAIQPQHYVNKHLRVPPGFKTGRRNVDVAPNLAKWIQVHGLEKVMPDWKLCHWKKFRKLCDWSPDVTRHTCISYWLQAHPQQEDRAKYMFGNSDRIRNEHYRDAVSDEDAEEFWNIVPREAKGKMLQFK